ncbi:MAG: hypothetical protein LWW79_06395 [Holophagaceae bacterium]|nr:hypothetical protein [Holophagaceae bacterium]
MHPDTITLIGTTIQTLGVWSLAALLFLMSRALKLDYLRAWARGWLCLAVALTALQVVFRWPSQGWALQAIYHFGELAFLWYLASGLSGYLDLPRRHVPSALLLGVGGAYSVALPLLTREFTLGFTFHAGILAGGFALMAWLLRSGHRDWSQGLGVWVTLMALYLLSANFAFHALALGSMRVRPSLPGAYLNFTSLYDLLFEMLLAFGLVVLALQDASRRIQTLTRLLPVCAWCRKIRDDQGYWSEFESWVRSQGQLRITHGACPDCKDQVMKTFREELAAEARGSASS